MRATHLSGPRGPRTPIGLHPRLRGDDEFVCPHDSLTASLGRDPCFRHSVFFHAVATPYLTTVARCGSTMGPGLRRGDGLTREAWHPRQPCVSTRETAGKPPPR